MTHASKVRAELSSSDRGLSSELVKVLALLRAHTDHDLSLYKKNTIQRRIDRRMHVHQISSVGKYVQFLQANPHEIDLLFKELLIGVTSFFRDPESFQVLKEKVLPWLIKQKAGASLRVWVPGCSTGEEAYSLAIMIRECVEQAKVGGHLKVQIFATDINKETVERARQGFTGMGSSPGCRRSVCSNTLRRKTRVIVFRRGSGKWWCSPRRT